MNDKSGIYRKRIKGICGIFTLKNVDTFYDHQKRFPKTGMFCKMMYLFLEITMIDYLRIMKKICKNRK